MNNLNKNSFGPINVAGTITANGLILNEQASTPLGASQGIWVDNSADKNLRPSGNMLFEDDNNLHLGDSKNASILYDSGNALGAIYSSLFCISDSVAFNNYICIDAGNDAIEIGGDVGIGVAAGTGVGKLDVRQAAASGAKPALRLVQGDVSEDFMRFEGTGANDLLNSIIPDGAVTTPTVAGYLKIFVQDDGNQVTDQIYFIPFYTLV